MESQFENKVIALTGAASGIGLATAKLLASRGAKLSLADLSQDGLDKAKREILSETHHASIFLFPLDVRQYAQVNDWITATVEKFGRLDGAGNIAGIVPKSIGTDAGKIEQLDVAEWDFAMDVNAKGVMHCLKRQLQAMSDNGSVVNMSSIAGLQGRDRNGAYAASKHAVLGLTRSAAKEVGVRGVRVNAVCPGRIETPMSRASANNARDGGAAKSYVQDMVNECALKRSGKAEEVAKLFAFLLSDESSYISGNAISIDGGWNC